MRSTKLRILKDDSTEIVAWCTGDLFGVLQLPMEGDVAPKGWGCTGTFEVMNGSLVGATNVRMLPVAKKVKLSNKV